jgi:hypothetical protein
MKKPDDSLRGKMPEIWACIYCGTNTAPGLLNRQQLDQALATHSDDQGVEMTIDERSAVKSTVWEAAGMELMGGCLCIGCLEKRLGRILTAEDFVSDHPFNSMPGTKLLLARRDR